MTKLTQRSVILHAHSVGLTCSYNPTFREFRLDWSYLDKRYHDADQSACYVHVGYTDKQEAYQEAIDTANAMAKV